MAIQLHEKYRKALVERYAHKSYVKGRTSDEYEWEGVAAITLTAIQTQPLNDYTRGGLNRFGEAKEVQDENQRIAITQDKAFALTVDNANFKQQSGQKKSGKVLKAQNDEQVVPFWDRYALNKYVEQAGKSVLASAELTKSNIVTALMEANEHFVDNGISMENTTCYMSAKTYTKLRTAPEFLGVDTLANKILTTGLVGKCCDFDIVVVPSSYLPAGVEFLCTKKDAVVLPMQINKTKVHQDPPGIDGILLEGHYLGDAGVVFSKANGVYVLLAKGATKVATPTITVSTGAIACATDGATIKYTLDGSDPRYSTTAATYTSALGKDANIRAYAFKDGAFASDVA